MRLAARVVVAVAVVSIVCGAGCANVLGLEDWVPIAEDGGPGGASSSGGGGGGSVVEDCGNGQDDDGDGLVDCLDTLDCGAYRCVPAPPPAWNGPAAFGLRGTCGFTWPALVPSGGSEIVAAPATCGCSCGAPAGEVCSSAYVLLASDGGCGAPVYAGINAVNACANIPDVTASSMIAYAIQAVGGTCAPLPSIDKPAPTFAAEGTLCQGADLGAGCGTELCAPPPGAGQSICVFQPGDLPCPGAAYTERTVVYRATTDTRGCSPCSCGPPAGSTCAGSTYIYSDSGCGAPYGPIPDNAVCYPFGGAAPIGAVLVAPAAAPAGGACGASPVAPVGEVVPSDPLTVCCLPPR